ncbi:MAG: G5 domain-containing protein, partial [Clostridia bacterium]|nr:G5 domain-containing protein [Clostridia bacterium]
MQSNNKNTSGSDNAKGTDVLDGNVSRETSGRVITEKEKKKKAQLDSVRQKGGITDDNPYDFNNPTLKELYDDFRRNKLTKLESGFNALYLWCYDNYYSSDVPIKDKYKNIYAHPSAWFNNAHHMWKHNKWSIAVRILEIVPTVARLAENSKERRKHFSERFWKTFEYSHKSASKALTLTGYLASFAAIVVMFGFWHTSSKQFDMIPALKLYVDGEYIGDVMSITDAEEAKRSVEKSLSINLGSTYKLDCSIDFEATRISEGANLTPARLSRAFGEVAHKEMRNGYGLYAYDVLVAVSPERSWLDRSMNQSLEQIIAEERRDTHNTEKISFNNFVVKSGSFPESFFSTEEEIMELFSLKNDSNNPKERGNNYLNVSEKTTLFTGQTTAGTSSDVSSSDNERNGSLQIAIETVITNRVTERETIPFGTDYIYTDELPENRQIVRSSGKNG